MIRQDKTGQDKIRQDKTGQNRIRQDETGEIEIDDKWGEKAQSLLFKSRKAQFTDTSTSEIAILQMQQWPNAI
jgi:hypothetical protein